MKKRQKHIEVSEWKKRAKFTQDELRQYLLEMRLDLLKKGKRSFELNLDSIRITGQVDQITSVPFYQLIIIESHKARALRKENEPIRYSSLNSLFNDLFEKYKLKCVDIGVEENVART